MTFVNLHQKPVKRFNNLFEEILNDFPTYSNDWKAGVPPVNISESKDAFILELNVPGRNKEDFAVTIEKGLLTISYEKKAETPKPEGAQDEIKSLRKEFTFQNFKRSFTLDAKINAEAIEAKYENGLLKFTLPKKEEVKITPKQIAIQ